MSLPVVLSLAAILILGIAGLAIWLVRRPLVELVVAEEKWKILGDPEFRKWEEENETATWVLGGRRPDGEYYLMFFSRRAARRFRERWLEDVPNQASLTHESRSGTGP